MSGQTTFKDLYNMLLNVENTLNKVNNSEGLFGKKDPVKDMNDAKKKLNDKITAYNKRAAFFGWENIELDDDKCQLKTTGKNEPKIKWVHKKFTLEDLTKKEYAPYLMGYCVTNVLSSSVKCLNNEKKSINEFFNDLINKDHYILEHNGKAIYGLINHSTNMGSEYSDYNNAIKSAHGDMIKEEIKNKLKSHHDDKISTINKTDMNELENLKAKYCQLKSHGTNH